MIQKRHTLALALLAAAMAGPALARDPELVLVPPAEPIGGPDLPVRQPKVAPPVTAPAEEMRSTLSAEGESLKEEPSKWWTLTVGFDIVTAYYGRGFIVEDDGFIFQPYASFAAKALTWEGGGLTFDVGTWNSVHSKETDADLLGGSSVDAWFECDLLTGATVEVEPFSVRLSYAMYANPNRGADPIHEFIATIALDDSGWMGDFALNPAITIAQELGDDSGDGFDGHGTYFEAGVTPGVTFDLGPIKEARLNFPMLIGLSINDYYQFENTAGRVEGDTFGYFQGGARLLIPLPMPEGWGAWTFSAGVSVIVFGDGLEENNADNRDTRVLGLFGVSASF